MGDGEDVEQDVGKYEGMPKRMKGRERGGGVRGMDLDVKRDRKARRKELMNR